MHRIVSILPKGEGFSVQQFGAIALCVRDFTYHSRYSTATTVIGGSSPQGFEGISYVYVPPGKWFENRTRSYARGCVKVIKNVSATLAEIHNRPHLVQLIASQVECKIALHLHNDPQEMDKARTARERHKLLKACDAVYCVSNYIRDRFLEGLAAEESRKVHVVYNGIAAPDSLPEKKNMLVFAGRMTEGKGAALLADALQIALPQLPDWHAILIGSRRHASAKDLHPHEKHIADILARLGSQVEMPGFLSHEETLSYFARASIAVIPSVWQEPFGRTAIEALAYGCALISSGRGALREVTNEAALTVDDLTPKSLAAAILLLAKVPHERKRLQYLGTERAKVFSIALCTKMLDDVRAQILAENDRYVA